MKDDLGQRMKDYENRTRIKLPRRTNTIIRIDGKAFHSYTVGMEKPFDKILTNVMDNTTLLLCREIQGAVYGYVQSDEISIQLNDYKKIGTDAWFDGNIQKICSVSASMTTGYFNQYMNSTKYADGLAFFDARTWSITQMEEVRNYFIWRQKDAVRNSIQMLARSMYSHKECNNKNTSELQEMCFQKGKNWNDMDAAWKRGRFAYKSMETKTFNVKDMEKFANTGNLVKVSEDEYMVERMVWKIEAAPDFLKDERADKIW